MKSPVMISLNPGKNYERIGEIAVSTREQVAQKVAQAQQAKASWAALKWSARRACLESLYQAFVQRRDEIGSLATQEMGMPASVRNLIDLDAGLLYMKGYLQYAQQWLAP